MSIETTVEISASSIPEVVFTLLYCAKINGREATHLILDKETCLRLGFETVGSASLVTQYSGLVVVLVEGTTRCIRLGFKSL